VVYVDHDPIVMRHAHALLTADFTPAGVSDRILAKMPQGSVRPRTRDEFALFFDGMDLVAPGVTNVASWRDDNEPQPRPDAADVPGYCAVAQIGR
jgi:hypothetical protein